jgi:hypothetical protein
MTLLSRLAFLWLTWLWYHFCHARFFMPKSSTHRMYDQDQLFHTYEQKVLTDNQMSQIKYNYYIDNVSKD